jgi:chemotaxis signal transduction protein
MSFSSEQHKADFHSPSPELNIQDLERMSDEEFWSYARQRAHAAPGPASHAEYVDCRLSGSSCLVPLHDLAEVVSPPYRLARLPGMPAWMAGIMAWRGETIAVVNLNLYFFSPQSADLPLMNNGALLIVHAVGHALGLLVPSLGVTMAVKPEEIAPLLSPHGLLAQEAGIFEGMYADRPILNISALLASLVQQIGMATAHG